MENKKKREEEMTKGWKLESARHSLARKGIETGRKLKAKWGKYKEKKEFEKTPIGKLTKLVEKLDKLGYTDEETKEFVENLKFWADKGEFGIAARMLRDPKQYLEESREYEERDKEFKKMEKDKEKFELAKEKFAKEKGRKPTSTEEDEILTKILESDEK